MSDFHKSIMGHRFFEGQVPALIQALKQLGEKLTPNRPCVVVMPNGDITDHLTFHCWANVVPGSNAPAHTMALVEYENGQVGYEQPEWLHFMDREDKD